MSGRVSRSTSARRGALVAASWLLAGCAHVYVDADGTRHVVGFVDLQLPPATGRPTAAESLRSRSFGVSLTRSDVGSAVVLGYSDTTLAFVRNHALLPAAALGLGASPVALTCPKE